MSYGQNLRALGEVEEMVLLIRNYMMDKCLHSALVTSTLSRDKPGDVLVVAWAQVCHIATLELLPMWSHGKPRQQLFVAATA